MVDSTLLLILNPRELPMCLLTLDRLDCPKVWLSYFTEWELRGVIANIINTTSYDRYVIVSDDCIVSQDAYDAVLDLHDRINYTKVVTTGYCNLDVSSPLVNLTKEPFRDSRAPDEGSYDWYSMKEVTDLSNGGPIWTGFAGIAFTCMSRDMWLEFPWDCYGKPRGWAADYHLALRLRDAGVPIWAPKNGFIYHTKKNWLDHSTTEATKIYVGERPKEIRWEI